MDKAPEIASFAVTNHSMRDGITHYLQFNWESGLVLCGIALFIMFFCTNKNDKRIKSK